MEMNRTNASFAGSGSPTTCIVAIGTATPETPYTQAEVLDILAVTKPRNRSVFLNSGIERRYLTMPANGGFPPQSRETQAALLAKHSSCGIVIGSDALKKCLTQTGAAPEDVSYLCCVTTTGLLTPGFSALLCQALAVRADCARLDVVGMGCNAGLNALNAIVGWSQRHPGEIAAMVCIEVCSAAYVTDDEISTAVVNSLFGDGSAAILVVTSDDRPAQCPAVLKFASYLIPQTLNAMEFSWSESHGKFRFSLERDVPYIVGAHVSKVVGQLLAGTGLRRSDIANWIVHSGGKKVIDSVKVNLGLSAHDMRHTSSVLRDYGNLSSGSFLFTLERLLHERQVAPGEYGVMLTMGPGSTLEAALLQW
jgi:polyketide synthase Type III